jgi:hypothetical protein
MKLWQEMHERKPWQEITMTEPANAARVTKYKAVFAAALKSSAYAKLRLFPLMKKIEPKMHTAPAGNRVPLHAGILFHAPERSLQNVHRALCELAQAKVITESSVTLEPRGPWRPVKFNGREVGGLTRSIDFTLTLRRDLETVIGRPAGGSGRRLISVTINRSAKGVRKTAKV